MTNKNFSILNIAMSTLSFAVILLSARNIIVCDFGANGHGLLISKIIQILLMLTFFLHGVKNYNLNRNICYIYFILSTFWGIVVMFIIFLL